MRLPDPFSWRHEQIAVELPGARGLFTTRRGGVSRGPYATLNLGRLTGDEPTAVDTNRARLRELVGRPLAGIRQVHGTRVKRLERLPDPGEAWEEADGQATAIRRVAPMVMVADCLPIVICAGGAVGVLHAGWRGLDGGVIAEGVRALGELGGTGELHAAIGPGAGVCCYEVGEEVRVRFDHYGEGVLRGHNLNLKAIARTQLEAAGAVAVHDVDLCTICGDPQLFFSHRREKGVTGRQGGVAWLS